MITGIDRKRLERAEAELRGTAGDTARVDGAAVDVRDRAAVEKLVGDTVRAFGGLDLLVNNAGAIPPGDLLSVDDARWRQAWDLKVFGYISFCRAVYARMKARRSGVIVNVSSLSATQGNPYMSAYSASKGAVLAFSLSLAAELSGRGIRVVPVSPGTTDTPLTRRPDLLPPGLDYGYFSKVRAPLGAAAPEQIASVIAFAAWQGRF